jgi:hypothetical protein
MEFATAEQLVVRWTIGAVRERGFEMLRLSIASAYRLFGPQTAYVVCVNTLTVDDAKLRTFPSGCGVPDEIQAAVEWRLVTRHDLPGLLLPYLDHECIEGMGWKLAPLRVYPERRELAIDNDVILWALPEGMRRWLTEPSAYLFAEDVDRCFGSFESLVPPDITPSGGLNAGIRGLPAGEDLSVPLRAVLQAADLATRQTDGTPLRLQGEIEEQGLQAAAMARCEPLYLVQNAEVSLCSPFWPKRPEFGSCGAHFVGMNASHSPWDYYDRPADQWLADHWERSRPELYRRAGLTLK